ncbi:MAG: hypothetical protein MNPFHGCM_02799 [Gemmatimonadaceae bacterium]|nr:hypothetical protein [Gemmatimonadaceae bacterium]
MDHASTPPFVPAHASPSVTVVRFQERLADAVAGILLLGGAGIFLFARQALTALANGTYTTAGGVTLVSRADLHSAQSRLGLWLAATGLAIAIASAMSHARTRRRSNRALHSGAPE